MKLSHDMLAPFLRDFECLSDEEKRERVADLVLAMTYGQAVLARLFLKVTPEDYGKRIGDLLCGTLTALLEVSSGAIEKVRGEKTTASVWDS